jgi:hypothetical protein
LVQIFDRFFRYFDLKSFGEGTHPARNAFALLNGARTTHSIGALLVVDSGSVQQRNLPCAAATGGVSFRYRGSTLKDDA